jgi:hypothetical protein
MNEKISSDSDWRIVFCDRLHGQAFQLKKWHPPMYNPAWDHDHCSACWKRIWDQPSSEEEVSAKEGYASLATSERPDDYDWICVECFTDLAESQDWSVADGAP